ncbi:uncharacterized protein LOC131631378 isoform X2 [Vicia villosa]|uniref:uncharacterized protein LOC131631378 isoform X2 n=1 Tax=Vicia villosa TaxID=3911 RepID=UPI00273C1013|nr:uncharacterized protein LOC131631378 isoform X2 [Vicia villosa]
MMLHTAFSWFLKLAFKFLHHFAWPLLALVYPLCASIQAIETDSYAETKNLISYWILLSFIYLFEYAFINLLPWLRVWLYIKLMIIFLLTIPDFGRASYVYNNVIRPMKLQIVVWRFSNYWRKCFVEKDEFLMHAERYVKENGTQALEKLIASKNTIPRLDAEVTNEIISTDNKEMLKTNGERLQIEHLDFKDMEAIEKRETPATKQVRETPDAKQDIPVMPKVGPSQSTSSATGVTKGTVESGRAGGEVPQSSSTQKEMQKVWSCASPATGITKGTAESDRAGGEVPQSSSIQKEMQKEWTCALCLVTTSSEITLNSHLSGRRHRAAAEALIAKKQPTLQKQKDAEVKNEILATDNKQMTNSDQRLQTEHKDIKGKKEIPATKQRTYANPVASQKASSSAVVETKGTAESARAGGEIPQSSSTLKEVQKEWTCALCLVTTSSEATLFSHLKGKKHMASYEAALKAKRQTALQKLKIYQPKEEVKQKNVNNILSSKVKNGDGIVNKEEDVKQKSVNNVLNSKVKNGDGIVNKVLKVVLDNKVEKLQKSMSEPVGIHNSKLMCRVCNAVLHCENNIVSHLNGKKHLANMQSKVDSLNNLRGIGIA